LEDEKMSSEEAVHELVERWGFERVRPEEIEPDHTALITSLGLIAESTGRIAENTGRTASGVEAMASQAPLMTPPIGVERVAELARVSVKTVYRWKEEGLLRPLADNRPLLFAQAEVHDFIRRRRRRGK